MRKFLLAIFTLLLVGKTANAQNVMSHLDNIYQYNSAAAVGSSTNPAVPAFGEMSKWVYDGTLKTYRNSDPRITNFDMSRFKCYFFNGMAFRLKFPKNYNPNGTTKYPLVLFMHGAGEAAPTVPNSSPAACYPVNRENRDQLYWGAQTFDERIEAGDWNGFLLFPQQNCDQSGGWDISLFEPINKVLDTLQKYHKFDQDRLIVMGLSSGGGGNINYASLYPKRVAVVATSDPAFGTTNPAAMKHIPTWIANGGQDPRPTPSQVHLFINNVRDLGGDTYQNFYATTGHFSWLKMWDQKDINERIILTDYWNRAHKAQAIVFYQKTQFCADAPVSARMGITDGFNAYEWQKNTTGTFVTIPGAIANEYTATEIGTYRVRFRATATAPWSDWSPSPIVISLKPCATDTLFVEHFDHYGDAPTYLYDGPSWGYKNYNYFRQSGLFVPGSETFTQDASGKQGGRFLFNHTYQHSASGGTAETTPYAPGDKVWRYDATIPVQFNTNYIFSFWVGNITNINPHVQIVPRINDVVLIPSNITPSTITSGNMTWTKYSYIWNSGFNGNALPELLNNTVPAPFPLIDNPGPIYNYNNGNDFAIDEISFTKLLAPGGVGSNMVLWSKPENLTGTPASGIGNWPNAAGNGKDLLQPTQASKPALSYEDADRINFNPVASFTTAGNDFLIANGSFTGTATHNAAHIYVVAKANSNTAPANNYFIQENLNSGIDKVEINLPNNAGNVGWAAGNLINNAVSTPMLAADVNKPLLWSFSKTSVGVTGSNYKQDIRKNATVMAFNDITGTFTGIDASLKMGAFDGKVAEVIYYLDANINTLAQNKIESYLALKYGITLNGVTNYTASNGTVFWTGSTTYQNDVFGIGRDNTDGLNQTVSNSMNTGSGTGIGQPAKGNIVVQKTTPLTDNQFLVMGNDAANLAEQTTDIPVAANFSGAKRIGREWKVNNTGSVGSVNISFDIAGLTLFGGGTTLGNFTLLIDNDGDGNFTTGTQTIKNANSINGTKVNFNGVTLNNNVVFTLITGAPTAGALPATWLSFNVEVENNNAVLNWKTADEINVSNYIVEHSVNGIDYAGIGDVAANNTTGVNAYSFDHNGLAEGTHYYRVRRVDFDGKFGYSIVKTIKVAKKGANVVIRTNPVTGKTLFLAITSTQNTRAAISVINAEGQTVLLQNTGLTSGTNNVNINLGLMANGVYMLRVQMGDETVTQKFVKAN
jgi:pimeloyl-ACP methyl ester carboxylesterase